MKILVVSQSFYPDNFKINKVVQDFVAKGYQVDVLTGLPDYETGNIAKEYRFFKNRKQSYNGTNVYRVPTFARRTGPIFRSLNYLSFAISGWFWALFNKNNYDVVYVYQVSPITMGIPAIKAAKRNNAKLIIYCMDIWPECVKAMNIKEETKAFNLIHKISKYVYSKADVIPISSPSFADYLKEENQISFEKTIYLPQYSEDIIVPVATKKTEDFNFLFTGNIGLVQDVEVIIKAVAEMKTNLNFKVHIVGDGSNLDNCIQLVKENQLEGKIIFHGRHPSSEMPSFYEMADACLLTLKNENKIGLTIPAKLQGYMSAGKAVVAAIDGDAKQIIEESNCGKCVSAGNVKEFADIMEYMMSNKEETKQLGMNGRKYFEQNFTEEKFISATLSVLLESK